MFELSPQIPQTFLIVLLACAAFAAYWRVSRKRDVHPLDFLWLLPAVAALIAAQIWCADGLYESESDPLAVVLLCIAALVEGACALARRPVLDALDAAPEGDRAARARREAARGGIALAALLASCALGWLALELPWNNAIFEIDPVFSTVELLIILGSLAILYFVCQRRGAGMAACVATLSIVGIAQFFVTRFKAASIMPGDLLALGTANEVSGTYTYSVDHLVVLGIACALVAIGICAFVAPSRPRTHEGVFGNVLGNVTAALVVGSLFWSGVTMDYGEAFDTRVDYWDSVTYYKRHGFLPSFVKVLQDIPIERPKGYSDEGAAELEEGYAEAYDAGEGSSPRRAAAEQQFDELRPSIVCIMNESFSDLSFLEGLRVGYAGPEFYNSWQGTTLRGDLAVSIQGGGTCNSEFEFLTGTSLAYVGSGKYPYTIYDLSEVPSLAKQLSELGYETTAIHPNLATNWNRETVFEQLGFDEFVDSDEFQESPWYHSGRTDASTYDKILEILRESDDPQFVFDITMQNHSSYTQGNIPADQLRNYAPEGLDESTTAQLNEYLACIDASDRDLRYFVEQLSQLDRPVILLFFGDHQPGITPEIVEAFYPGTDDLTQAALCYQSTYALWANYPIASGTYAEDGSVVPAETVWDYTSPAYLAAMMLDVSGAPLTELQKAQLALRDDLPALSIVGARLADGSWIEADDSRHMPDAYDDLAQITYLEFARKVE